MVADEGRLDRIAQAFAGIIDAKSPWTYRHSDRACVIVMSLAAALGCDVETWASCAAPRCCTTSASSRSPTGSSTSPASSTAAEFAKVREHPVVTARILERVPGFQPLAAVAAAHHERLDGGGYPRRLGAPELTPPMRMLGDRGRLRGAHLAAARTGRR